MVRSLNNFVSLFNFGTLQSKRRIQIENTFVNKSILDLFLDRGYILSYSILSFRFIEVYQNFIYSRFKLKIFSKSVNNFTSHHKLKILANSGHIFVVSTPIGYIFSDIALINGLGGVIIFEVKSIS